MNNILIEPKSSPYIFIYVSREYYDGKCLNENRLGIGKSKDPLQRLKDHNSASSKISVEVKFELIYKTKELDTFFHNILKSKGYKQFKREIFEGTKNRPLTLSEIKNVIEQYSVDGPWIYKNNQFIKLKSNTQSVYSSMTPDEKQWQWEQDIINSKYEQFEKPVMSDEKQWQWEQDIINSKYEQFPKPVRPARTTINCNITKSSETKKKFNKTYSLDEQWEDDLHQFHFESWLVGLPAQFIFQICLINSKRFQYDKIGFIVFDFGVIILHALIQTFIYHSFKNKWIEKHY